MNILICEDEQGFAEELQKTLERLLAEKELPCHIECCFSGSSFLARISEASDTDLLFMDIQLGDADGVELMKQLHQTRPKLTSVFLTGMEDRIAEGYDVNAFSFLFKRNYAEKLPALLDRYLSEIYHKRTIALQDKGNLVMVDFADIYYVEADKRNTLVHTKAQTYTETRSVQSFANLLPGDLFPEVYHALFVNIDHIKRVDTDSLELDNRLTLPVSRRKRKELMTAIMRRIQNR